MYEVYKHNVEFWTFDKLAQRFGIQKEKVKMIIMVKETEEQMRQETPHLEDKFGDLLDFMVGIKFKYHAGYGIYHQEGKKGMIGYGKEFHALLDTDDRVILEKSLVNAHRFPAFTTTDEDLDLQKVFFATTKKKWYPEKLPKYPSKKEMDFFRLLLPAEPGEIILPPPPKQKGSWNGRKRYNKEKSRAPRLVAQQVDLPFRELTSIVVAYLVFFLFFSFQFLLFSFLING
jgi:hypothetical protein